MYGIGLTKSTANVLVAPFEIAALLILNRNGQSKWHQPGMNISIVALIIKRPFIYFMKIILSPIHMHKKYMRVNILQCVNILRCANQPMSKFKLCSHGFYHFWIKSCSFKFSVFAKQEEAALRCSCRLWQQSIIM